VQLDDVIVGRGVVPVGVPGLRGHRTVPPG
jgi:hypothetical protein